ncbi:PHD finger protein 6 isoform X2 [Syngnathoides biaculeatus]|uniref:PHD finger protein 6 isoform X2 n=1 Tax=Syngnathoides biaculeatus TaxID=300417 RepID=UPI002ADD4BF2|nr:PHD finger protein 6 isoform X2 [Syngnathoides biaculeatus]
MEMVPSPKLRCLLCQRSGETEVTGPLLSKVDVTAHQNCLLFSSGIYCTDSPLFDDLFGFSVEDVMDEVCAKCKKRGATAGCEVKNCSKCYHYPCAIEDVAETVVDSVKGKYQLFCLKHGPGQQQRKGPSSNEGDPAGSASDAKSGSQSKRELILADAETNTPSKKKKILSISSSSGEEEDPGKSLAPIQDSDLDEDLNLKPCPPVSGAIFNATSFEDDIY